VSISVVRNTLNFLATLLAGVSLSGLLFVVFFLLQGERGAAAAQTIRREE
jgi:hypothetical protein